MADSVVFDWACETLERVGGISRLQARGTMRIVLGQAGLDPRSVRASQLRVVVARLLPRELRARGLTNVEATCAALAACPVDPGAPSAEPEEIFKRLGRRE